MASRKQHRDERAHRLSDHRGRPTAQMTQERGGVVRHRLDAEVAQVLRALAMSALVRRNDVVRRGKP